MRKLLSVCIAMLLVVMMVSGAFAAVTSQVGLDGTYSYIANIVFGADSDTYGSLTHGVGGTATELEYTLTPLDANCMIGVNASGVVTASLPYVNDISTTTIGIGKANVQGSATCSVRVTIRQVHSIIQ